MGKRREKGCFSYLRVLPLMKESHVPGKLAVSNITQGCDKVTLGPTVAVRAQFEDKDEAVGGVCKTVHNTSADASHRV